MHASEYIKDHIFNSRERYEDISDYGSGIHMHNLIY